jgi:hypothetical protein
MPNTHRLTRVAFVCVGLGAIGLAALSYNPSGGVPAPGSAVGECPRLAVLVVFDQLRADYLTRWDDLFVEGGFRRLKQEGASFEHCNINYAQTLTAPGHATLATGCAPRIHGIVGNTWYDRTAADEVYCVYADRYEIVPLVRGKLNEQIGAWPGSWPGRLQADTLGDALKRATQGQGRVVSLSMKDRSAIPMACREARVDACYWFFPPLGAFVTSTFYRPSGHLHPWVADFNKARHADAWFSRDWTRLRPNLDYERYSGPDDVAAEGTGWMQGRTFPHPMKGGLDKPGRDYYEALANSAYANDLLLALTKQAMVAEGLGTRKGVSDLLCVSFSGNDLVGHTWGPDSQEVLDVTLRSDLITKTLLDTLDERVGRGRYVLVLTSDHGVCPLPAVARQQGKDAGHVSFKVLDEKAEDYLSDAFFEGEEKGKWIKAISEPWIYLNHELLREHDLQPNRVEEALADWLCRQAGIQRAYTRTRLLRGPLSTDPIGERVRQSFYADRSGDVAVVLKPYHLWGLPLSTGTTHGSPHSYDTHVPLLIYGPGIRPGVLREAVTPQAVAAILARTLRINPPRSAQAPVPSGLFE